MKFLSYITGMESTPGRRTVFNIAIQAGLPSLGGRLHWLRLPTWLVLKYKVLPFLFTAITMLKLGTGH